MIVLDGKKVAKKLKEKLKIEIEENNLKPGLAVISIGDDPASKLYVNLKHKTCAELGIYTEEYHFENEVTQEELIELIDKLNADNNIHGILLQSPIPYHLNILDLFNRIAPEKDVDGFNPINVGKLSQGQNAFAPCTPLGIMHILNEYKIDLEGKNSVVIGRSNIVGRPMAQLLINANATVTVCHSKTQNLSSITKTADLLIVACRKA